MHKLNTLTRLLLVAAIIMGTVPVSASAESRPDSRTELRELARELERIFGEGSVDVRPSTREGRNEPARSDRPSHHPDVHQGRVPSDAVAAVEAMNRERARRGLGPLRVNPQLTAAAESKAIHMQRYRYFDHVSPQGLQPADFARSAGYRYSMLGENLAVGFESSDAVIGGWMRSDGHRENILGAYDEVGVALLDGSPVRGYSGDTWVAIYGRR